MTQPWKWNNLGASFLLSTCLYLMAKYLSLDLAAISSLTGILFFFYGALQKSLNTLDAQLDQLRAACATEEQLFELTKEVIILKANQDILVKPILTARQQAISKDENN